MTYERFHIDSEAFLYHGTITQVRGLVNGRWRIVSGDARPMNAFIDAWIAAGRPPVIYLVETEDGPAFSLEEPNDGV